MVSRKYIKDYRLDYVSDKKGKLKAVPVYQGKLFCFEQDKKVVRKSVFVTAILIVLSICLYLIPLLLEEVCMKKYYVLLPFAVLVFPIFYACSGLYTVAVSKEDITRMQHDRGQLRLKAASFVCIILSLLSAVGQIVYAFKYGLNVRNVYVLLCTLGICVIYVASFLRCRNFAMVEKK